MANVSRKCEEHCTPTHLQWELAVLELEVGLYNVDPTTILNWLSTYLCLFAQQGRGQDAGHGAHVRVVSLHGCFNFCVILQLGGLALPWCDAFVLHETMAAGSVGRCHGAAVRWMPLGAQLLRQFRRQRGHQIALPNPMH